MEVSTKELRIQPGKIIDQVVQGEEITVTFRGKVVARIVPVAPSRQKNTEEVEIFGMWNDQNSNTPVDDVVRALRKGRSF